MNLPDPNPEAVARLLELQDVKGVTFHFFPALGLVVEAIANARKLAIARQFYRWASRESGWDVDVMSQEEFEIRQLGLGKP